MKDEQQEITTGIGLLDSPAPPEQPTSPSNEVEQAPIVETQQPPPPPTGPPLPTGQLVYFKKTIANMAFFVNKKPVPFEMIGGNIGVIKLDSARHEDLVSGLLAAAQGHKGGVSIIDAETYADLKKNLPYVPSVPKSQPSIRVWDRSARLQKSESAGVSAARVEKISASPVAPAVVEGAAGAGKSSAVPITPNLVRKSSGPVLRPPSTGKFRPEVPILK